MSGKDNDIDLSDLLGPEPDAPDAPAPEVLVDAPPKSDTRRAMLARSARYPVMAAAKRLAKKNKPEILKRLLSYIAEMPVLADACFRAGITTPTLKYWLQQSLEGRVGDGFDMALGESDETGDGDGDTVRFHIAWDAALEIGIGATERAVHQRGTGYWEILTYKGAVVYKLDPKEVEVALLLGDAIDNRNPALWLRDKFGAPVPESVWKMDPDLAMFILKTRKPQTYGPKSVVEHNIRGGVLVIPMRAVTSEDLNTIEEEYRVSDKPLVTFEDDDDGEAK